MSYKSLIAAKLLTFYRAIFDGSGLTATRTYTLPDKAGTFALTSDVNTGDDMFGNIARPTPALSPVYNFGAYNNAGQGLYVPSVAGDGGYFVLTLTTLTYYSSSGLQVWSIAASTVNFSGVATNMLGIFYFSGFYYFLAYRSGAVNLYKLSNPYVNNSYTTASGTVALTNSPALILGQITVFPYGSNFKLRWVNTSVYDVVFSSSAKISEGAIAQSGLTLTYDMGAVTYESTDGTIQCGIVSYDAGRPFHLKLYRGGKYVIVPITWLAPRRNAATTIQPIILGSNVYFAAVNEGVQMGLWCVTRTSFDTYLAAIATAAGI